MENHESKCPHKRAHGPTNRRNGSGRNIMRSTQNIKVLTHRILKKSETQRARTISQSFAATEEGRSSRRKRSIRSVVAFGDQVPGPALNFKKDGDHLFRIYIFGTSNVFTNSRDRIRRIITIQPLVFSAFQVLWPDDGIPYR